MLGNSLSPPASSLKSVAKRRMCILVITLKSSVSNSRPTNLSKIVIKTLEPFIRTNKKLRVNITIVNKQLRDGPVRDKLVCECNERK